VSDEGVVLRDELDRLLAAEPFEPFRIKLLNGDWHDIFNPRNVALMELEVFFGPPDQNWFVFPIDKIASIESLMADFHGDAHP
jgi:hypothetical protein